MLVTLSLFVVDHYQVHDIGMVISIGVSLVLSSIVIVIPNPPSLLGLYEALTVSL